MAGRDEEFEVFRQSWCMLHPFSSVFIDDGSRNDHSAQFAHVAHRPLIVQCDDHPLDGRNGRDPHGEVCLMAWKAVTQLPKIQVEPRSQTGIGFLLPASSPATEETHGHSTRGEERRGRGETASLTWSWRSR